MRNYKSAPPNKTAGRYYSCRYKGCRGYYDKPNPFNSKS